MYKSVWEEGFSMTKEIYWEILSRYDSRWERPHFVRAIREEQAKREGTTVRKLQDEWQGKMLAMCEERGWI